MRINEYLYEFLSITRMCIENQDYSVNTINCLKNFTPYFNDEMKKYIEEILNKVNSDDNYLNKKYFEEIINHINLHL